MFDLPGMGGGQPFGGQAAPSYLQTAMGAMQPQQRQGSPMGLTSNLMAQLLDDYTAKHQAQAQPQVQIAGSDQNAGPAPPSQGGPLDALLNMIRGGAGS